MKIVVIGTRGFPKVQGGVENHCQNLYGYLANHGCEIVLFARKPYVGNVPYVSCGVKVIPLFAIKNKYLESILHTFHAIISARKHKPDILHIHGIGPGVLIPLAKILGYTVVLTTHGENYKHSSWGFIAKKFLRFCEFISVKSADNVIAVSNHTAKNIIEKYGIQPKVIPNGINIKKTIFSNKMLQKYDLKQGKYFVYIGRLVPEKGIHDLIQAFANSYEMDWKLVIVGDADRRNRYSKNVIKCAKNVPGIIMMGCLSGDALYEVFSNAGVFVLPSYYEGTPIALLEAMGFGLNCLISDIEATRELPFPERNYFNPGDINSLSNKLLEFSFYEISNQQKILQLNLIKTVYNWTLIAKATSEVYNSALIKSLK